MLAPAQITRITPKLWMVQLTSLAILVGACAFAFMVLAIMDWEAITGNIKMMTLIGAVTGLCCFGLAFIAPRLAISSTTHVAAQLLTKNVRTEIDDAKIIDAQLENIASANIMFAAIVEAAVFLNLVTLLLEQSTAALVIVGIGFLLLIFNFPIKHRIINRLETGIQDIRREMQLID
jgi:hypothetical protein